MEFEKQLNQRFRNGDAPVLQLMTYRDTSWLSIRCAALAAIIGTLLCLMAPGFAAAQSIVKWVDAQGQTHYSDHAPTGQDTEAVSVHVSRPHSMPAAPAATSNSSIVNKSTDSTHANSNDTAAAREAAEQQRRAEQQEAAETARAQADKDLVARCNQAHETYCNQGADTIRQRDTTRAEIQYAEAINARQERISRGRPAGVLPPPPP